MDKCPDCAAKDAEIARLRAALALIRAEVDAICIDDIDGTKSMALAEIDAALHTGASHE